MPPKGIASDSDPVFVYINDWASLDGHAYIKLSGSAKGCHCQYDCIFSFEQRGMEN